MKGETEAQRRYLDLVGQYLRDAYGEDVRESADRPSFFVPTPPNGVWVRVSAIGEDEVVVDAYTWIGHELEVTAEVEHYLLERNASLRFGKVGIDTDGDLLLEHSLFPEAVEAVVLERVVDLVASVADDLEWELAERFGRSG